MLRDLKTLIGNRTAEEIAIEDYKRKLRENPEQPPEVHLALGKLYEKVGDKHAAIQAYTISVRLYENAGDTARAMAVTKLILNLDPQDKDALANLSLMNFEQGTDIKESERFFREMEDSAGEPVTAAVSPPHKKTIGEGVEKHPKGDSQTCKTPFVTLAKENTKAADEMTSHLRQLPLFSNLSHAELLQVKEHTVVWACPKNTLIAQDDQNQPSLFVILDGCVNIVERLEENQEILVAILAPGDFWGEDAFFGQHDVQLSAMTDSACTVLELSGTVVRSLAKKRPQIVELLKQSCKRWMFYPTLARVPLFKYLTDQERQAIADYLALVNVKKGTVIIAEGDLEESLYLIKSGKVGVYTTFVEREELQVIQIDQRQLYLATLQAGDFFGESAFLTKEPREASISALTDVQLLKLPKSHLEHLIKNYPEIEKILNDYHRQRTLENMKTLQTMFH